MNDLCALLKQWRAEGFDMADGVIAEKLGASIAVTRTGDSQNFWRKSLGIAPDPVLRAEDGVPLAE
jgi:hypothetical protein